MSLPETKPRFKLGDIVCCLIGWKGKSFTVVKCEGDSVWFNALPPAKGLSSAFHVDWFFLNKVDK